MFQRARTEEQREVRRQAILTTAAAMLAEMPVSALSLNELSRRVGLAKSNVLRYFETREAVLLELLDAEWRSWLDALNSGLASGAAADGSTSVAERIEHVAAVLVSTLAARPMLCELASASSAVLERNVSVEAAVRFKRAARADVDALARLVRTAVPELDEPAAQRFATSAVLVAGSVWAYSRPSAAMLAAYEVDSTLAAMRLDFGDALRELLATLLAGLLARPPR
jgi:AcrR family transcriptional regulator